MTKTEAMFKLVLGSFECSIGSCARRIDDGWDTGEISLQLHSHTAPEEIEKIIKARLEVPKLGIGN